MSRLTADEIRCPECSRVVLISDEGLCHHRDPLCADDCCLKEHAGHLEREADTRTEAELLAAHDGAGFVSTEWAQIADNDPSLGDWWRPAMTDEGQAS